MTDNEDAHEHEMFGRVHRCMREIGHVLGSPGVTDFRSWRRGEGGFAFEWEGGPHAVEVMRELEELSADNETTTALLPDDITDVEEYAPGWVSFHVRGVPIQLRPLRTIGIDAAWEQFRAAAAQRRNAS